MKLDFLNEFEFFTGVPDSQLKPLCNYLIDKYGIGKKHIIAANEGNAVGIAAGYHLATGKIPVVYMQNSGEGNIINPVASLMNNKVYAMPCLFIIGWRGEPGVHDEPQHIFQGEITLKLLDDLDIKYFVITTETTESEVYDKLDEFKSLMSNGKQTAFVVSKGALDYENKIKYSNSYELNREKVVEIITEYSNDDVIVSTTGKISRELFEIREKNNQGHEKDFLTVGSMGHASSIALGVALNRPDKRVWLIDGDGSMLMHMGSLAVIGSLNPKNIIHIVINNSAHETVGGMPTVAGNIDINNVASGCGYYSVYSVDNETDLRKALTEADLNTLTLIEIKTAIGSRADLGRPTTTTIDNKNGFMDYIQK